MMSGTPRFVLPLVLLAGLALPFCAQHKDPHSAMGDKSPSARLFSYDHCSDPALLIDSVRTVDSILIRDGHFASCSSKHKPIRLYIIRPAGNGPFAGVLFFHWLGRPKGNREEFVDEAIQLAHAGVVSVLVQGYFPWQEDPAGGSIDKQQVIDQTIDTRRALDILAREPGVDPDRLAFVGHDYGAMFGAIMAGVESRAKAYVLVAAMGNFSDWSLKYWPSTAAGGEQVYRDALEPVDPIHYVAYAGHASILFQFSTKDIYIPNEAATAFSDAVSGAKTVRWYDAAHDMTPAVVARDRSEWLARQLELRMQ
jgi:dienelactone hydrolase